MFNRFFKRKAQPSARAYTVPAGQRVYAIGDIHGRLDLFNALLDQIATDDKARAPAKTTIVLLGDLADRGPDSKGVIDRAITLSQGPWDTVMLMGNHEELMIRCWEGERSIAATFHRAGARATLISYGVNADDYDSWDLDEVTRQTGMVIPRSHIDFLRGFVDWHQVGDYLFVHAGIAPGIAIEDQSPADLRWIRRSFIESDADHGALIIHGHTITDAPDVQDNRIGIDTGAFASGTLTAIGLEGEDRWFLST